MVIFSLEDTRQVLDEIALRAVFVYVVFFALIFGDVPVFKWVFHIFGLLSFFFFFFQSLFKVVYRVDVELPLSL